MPIDGGVCVSPVLQAEVNNGTVTRGVLELISGTGNFKSHSWKRDSITHTEENKCSDNYKLVPEEAGDRC